MTHTDAARRPPARLRMDPELCRRGMLDGAWWPRSRDTCTELRDLIALLSTRLGPVTRVALNSGEWTSNPRRLAASGRIVRLGWFRDALRASVSVPTLDNGRFELLVVPPHTPETQAHAAMRTAADSTNPAAAHQILAAQCTPQQTISQLQPRASSRLPHDTTSVAR